VTIEVAAGRRRIHVPARRHGDIDSHPQGGHVYFKQFLDEKVGCASYLIASRRSHEAVIVDPAVRIEPYVEILQQRDFRLALVVDTHVHADHVSGARALAARFGVPVALHESAQVSYPFRPLHDGEDIPLGQLRLHVLHTPGHRRELISLLVVNPERSPEPSMVLTGDSLLVGDVGRPDFGGGDAAQQYDSVTRLLRLPDWVAVFPGHFEGPCGKGMCGRPSTTIGFERLFNPLLRLDREPFVRALTDGVPARPLNMVAIEATNRGAADAPWAMLTSLSDVPSVPAESLGARPADAKLIDVREPEEYAAGHVPGAVNVPQSELASRIDELPANGRVYVICQGGMRSLRSAQFLVQQGFRDVVNAAGGTGAWVRAGLPVERLASELPARRIVETEWAHAGVGLES
jgi:glyoxylase-like metal-dependent hydrolase (beta-lactamase superfamily II)/rhodanese-related sulfurtransferase